MKAKHGITAPLAWCAALTLLLATSPAFAGGNASLDNSNTTSRKAVARHEDQAALIQSKEMWQDETYAALIARYWQWLLSIPYSVGPFGDTAGVNCGINQHGPVWFLAAPGGKVLNNACTLPAGKAIVSGLFDGYDDYPCPPGVYGTEYRQGQNLEDFLHNDILGVRHRSLRVGRSDTRRQAAQGPPRDDFTVSFHWRGGPYGES